MKSKNPKSYNPKEVESKIYKLWTESGFFNPDNLPGKREKAYTIMLPLPNVTGKLHMGHALNSTVQDILIRWKRLQGYKTLWVPGTDHAGIATQVKVEKELKKEGRTRFDLGKEKFLEKVWEWKDKYENIILSQFKEMGVSADWSRKRFTMDEKYSQAIKKAFLHYYEKGMIYQKERPINWCPRCKTSLSDLELKHKEENGKLWYVKYPLEENSEKFIVVATTRPETMLGDTAVAVNSKDERYANLVGKNVVLPLVNKKIPIISDETVDKDFGTGAVKVTPAHSMDDYNIGLAHNLEIVSVINKNCRMTNTVSAYQDSLSLEARKNIVKDLDKLGLIEKIEKITHQVPYCDRCDTRIEILPSTQWFLKMKGLAKIAKEEVKSGRIKFHPKRFEKTYFDWLKNVRDWCISRQLWWGHKIPIEGSEDVLDTWFSSALWPFVTLGWPEETKDLKTFYPTDVLSTARDIINLWVSRMIFSGMEFMEKKPFKDVFIHPTVLTKDGRRMSKSLGTGIDPMILIEKYSADAVRFGLAWQLTGGQDIRFNEDSIIMGKKFCNKIWNASKFVMFQLSDDKIDSLEKIQESKLTKNDKKILNRLEKTVKSITDNLETFSFGQAAQSIYDFFWHDFCDKYIEEAKAQIKNSQSEIERKNTKAVLFHVLLSSLKLLHPFIPFVTEEIYQSLPFNKKKCLMIEDWPTL
jgi:valyl-tRNA synthetase